jgi:RNA polymerase sigma-70 factor (ECF subfamily)
MGHSNKNDDQLIREVLNGEREAFRPLVDRHAPMVFSLTNRYTRRESDAEELAQEIFVKAYERLTSFDGASKFSTWLYSLARNHCLDYAKNIRRKNRSLSELDEYELEQQMGESDPPDERIEREERIALMEQALQEIKQEYAEAFLLKYKDQLTYQAMADRLGVTVSALKLRVHRAKKELRTFMLNHS